MPAQPTRGFPLFPLGIVALPSESIPLHIFEDRYRTMIERCLAAVPGSVDGAFGVLWLSEEKLEPVGCACEVEEVLERMDDGRLNILARGTRPIRLLKREHDLPYPAGTIEFLSDSAESPDSDAAATTQELYRELVRQAAEREIGEDELVQMSAYEMAATVEFELAAKQELLELRSENARLGMLTGLLEAAIERLGVVERARARAASNGKVRFG